MRYELKAVYTLNGVTVTANGVCDAANDIEAEAKRLEWLAGLEAKAVDSVDASVVKTPFALVSSEKKVSAVAPK